MAEKYPRLLRLAKLCGGCEHWAVAWHPDEYENHIATTIRRLTAEVKRYKAAYATYMPPPVTGTTKAAQAAKGAKRDS